MMAGELDGPRLEVRGGNTEIVGMVEDQAEQGVLDTVTGLGLSLVAATPLDE